MAAYAIHPERSRVSTDGVVASWFEKAQVCLLTVRPRGHQVVMKRNTKRTGCGHGAAMRLTPDNEMVAAP
jgi:hypothetical protein